MRVTARLFGALQRHANCGTVWEGDIPAASRISDLLTAIPIDAREVVLALIDGKACHSDAEIPNGSEVTLLPHVGGG